MGKLLLNSVMIWFLVVHPTFAMPFNQNPWPNAAKDYWISQNSVPAKVTQAVRKDLSQRTKIASSQLKVQNAQPMTWPDGCLGLAKPDEFCTQMLVPGWQVTLTHQQHTWTYRTDSQGQNIRLAAPH